MDDVCKCYKKVEYYFLKGNFTFIQNTVNIISDSQDSKYFQLEDRTFIYFSFMYYNFHLCFQFGFFFISTFLLNK